MAKSALEVIEHEAASLRDEVGLRTRKIEEIQAEIEDIEGRVAMLDDLIEKIKTEQVKKAGKKGASPATNGEMPTGLGPSLAVLHYLNLHPGGATKPDIVAELEDKVRSKADDKRRVLTQILIHLETKTGEIERKKNGRYYLTGPGKQKIQEDQSKSGRTT